MLTNIGVNFSSNTDKYKYNEFEKIEIVANGQVVKKKEKNNPNNLEFPDEIINIIINFQNKFKHISKLSLLNKKWRSLVDKDPNLWDRILSKQHFSSLDKNQKQDLLQSTKQHIRNIFSKRFSFSFNLGSLKESMQNELMQIENIHKLQQISKARDVIIVWKILQKYALKSTTLDYSQSNKIDLDLENFNSVEELIDMATGFSSWFHFNQVKLSSMHHLDLSQRNLTSVPDEIWLLKDLQVLDLRSNNLTWLSDKLGQLINLNTLELNYNELNSLPAELAKLVNLENLHVNYNLLTSVPAELKQLIKLTYLDLSYNELSQVPAELGLLINLHNLSLNNNQLNSVPVELGQLLNLWDLRLNCNLLTSVPTELGKIRELRRLSLRNNMLTSIPDFIDLLHLNYINLSQNPLTSLPNFKVSIEVVLDEDKQYLLNR